MSQSEAQPEEDPPSNGSASGSPSSQSRPASEALPLGENAPPDDRPHPPFREQVRRVMEKVDLSLKEKVQALLQTGLDWFGLEVGFLAEIDLVESAHRTVVAAGAHPKLQEGAEAGLPQTYCREIVTQSEIFSLEDAEQQGWAKDPAYQKYDLSCYLGTKILVDGQLYGTVCFGSRTPSPDPLGPGDEAALELVAQSIERILEQYRRQQETDQLRDKYELLLEAAPNAIILADINTGRIVEANQKAAELIGIGEEKITGLHQTELHPDEEADRYRRLFQECCRPGVKGTVRRFEDGSSIYVQTDGGEEIPVEISAATVDVGGRKLAVGIFRDVRERRRKERELRRRSDAMEAAIDGMAILDSEGTYQYVNQAHADVYGYDAPESLLGRSWTLCYDEEERRHLESEAMSALREEGEWRGEATGRRADGSSFPQELTLTRLEDGSIICVVRDITARKKRERALRERREKIEALYEATRRVLTAESREQVSDRIHELLGNIFDYPLRNTGFADGETIFPEQTTAEGPRVPSPEPQPKSGDSLSARALRAGDTVVIEDASGLDNDVEYGDLRSAAAVPIGKQGVVVVGKTEIEDFDPFNLRLVEILGSYAALVLGRLNREEALREAKDEARTAQAEAEAASRAKSTMLANMSHEIRTPLTSIIGFADILGQEAQDGETAARFSRLIEESGRRLLNTLDGVLNLSKLEAGQMELEETTVDLAGQAEAIAEEMRPKAEESGLSLQVDTGRTPAWAHADEGGVQIVLQNLLSNAIKYTDEGEVRVRIYREEDAAQNENAAVLEVEDTGIGMDAELAEGLFEPFRQESEGLDREYEGTGLGLTVTKKAVDQMGGSIEVETEKGVGSCFVVRLPGAER